MIRSWASPRIKRSIAARLSALRAQNDQNPDEAATDPNMVRNSSRACMYHPLTAKIGHTNLLFAGLAWSMLPSLRMYATELGP